ncbi:MAG: SusC/RagA family TonB-linked outer membrane protein [Flavobacteriaceae bacterium]|nr:MAG: SusC/RagA family TonB-linked outer membrane protein [Flavobacteriaceae bacterium]
MKRMLIKKLIPKARSFLLFGALCVMGVVSVNASAKLDDTVNLGDGIQSTVTGVVTDENGVPLPGASVVEKGTTNGTVTDFDGNYSIEAAGDATLIFSYIGYKAIEVAVDGQATVNASLETDASQLDEVIVVGYGTQRKKDITGAITSVSGDDLNITRESNALNALAGKVAGLDVGISSTAPGSSPNLLIRGRSSLNFSNEPLIVLDGIPLEGNLSDINSADIASVQVLKDASSAAIYGARGANGVILITTKRGKVGKARFTYDTYYGFSEVAETYDVWDADQYVNNRREANRSADEQADGVTPGTYTLPSAADVLEPLQLAAYNAGINTDFFDLGLHNGKQVSHQLGVSGGSEKVRYALSLSYFEQEGVYKLADYKRYTFRSNIDVNATDKLKFGLSQQINFSKRNSYDALGGIMRNSPLVTPYDENGVATLDPISDGLRWNFLSNETPGNYVDERVNYRYLANIFASYQILDELKFTLNLQPQFESIADNDYRASQSANRTGALSQANKDKRENTAYTIENILNYSKVFKDDHSLDATFLYSFQETKRDFLRLRTSGPASDSQLFNNLSDASQVDSRDSSLETEGWTSYMGRFNYGYKSKYLLTLTGRYDGSSKLSEGNKWGFFPSASFAWRILEEDFLSDQTVFSDLKLRTGYGQVGRNPISPYATLGGIERFEGSFGSNPAFGFQPEDIANPDLKWETTTTFDIGIDFAFANNRISGAIDYYTGNTNDLLLNRVLPATSGFESILQNVGETKNSGFEVVLSTVNINTEDFKWTTNFNFSTNKSEIVSLLDSTSDDIGNGWFIGESLSVDYDRVFDGIWQLEEEALADSFGRRPGDIKLKDVNGDGVLNDDDRQIIGQRDPKWIGGLTSKIEYKGLDFTVALYTRQGNITRSRALSDISIFGRYNDLDLDYWTPENPSNTFPRANADRERPLDRNVLSYVDGSFVRIRNITLGYNFDAKVAEYLGLEKFRLYATAQNPFLFTSADLKGYDPETGRGNLDDGILNLSNDYTATPRTILFGLNVSF